MPQLIRDSDLSWQRTAQQNLMPESGTIYRFTEGTATADGMGGYNDAAANWVSVGTVSMRARPMDLRGRGESLQGAQQISLLRWDLTLDYDADVTAKDTIKSGDRVFEIVRVNNDESWLTAIRCEASTLNEMENRA